MIGHRQNHHINRRRVGRPNAALAHNPVLKEESQRLLKDGSDPQFIPAPVSQPLLGVAQIPHKVVAEVDSARVIRVLPSGVEIVGRVILRGVPPPQKQPSTEILCEGQPLTNSRPNPYTVDADGSLADVVVYVASGPTVDGREFDVPESPVVVEISSCLSFPYVFAGRDGQSIEFRNLDASLNLVWVSSPSTPHFLSGTVLPHSSLFKALPAGMRFQAMTSPMHSWMFSYVSSFAHPWFSVTQTNGEYSLPALQTGRHVIVAHHRKAGSVRYEVAIEDNKPTGSLNFELISPEVK